MSDAPVASIEAEQALLGVLMYDNAAVRAMPEHLTVASFYEPFHGRLYRSVVDTVESGMAADAISLVEDFRADPAFKELGGVRYLADLIDRAPPSARAKDYASKIVDLANRRGLMSLGAELSRMALSDGSLSSARMIEIAEAELMKIRLASAETSNLVSARTAAENALAEIEMEVAGGKPKGAQTGLACFDRRLGGLPPGWLITIGGRPSMGKSAAMRSAMYGAARNQPHETFAIFSLEMSARELSERALSASTWGAFDAVKTEALNRSTVTPTDLVQIHERVREIPDNLFIDDGSHRSVAEIERAVWTLKAKGKLRAIAVDYLQLMQRPQAGGRNEASVIGEITQRLKRLAKAAQICIVLLSQLSRGVDGREDKRPNLSDLRDSGSIEQDSDVVMFPYREAYYLQRAEPAAGTAEHKAWEDKLALVETTMEVAVAKLRQGAIGVIKQFYSPAHDLIKDF